MKTQDKLIIISALLFTPFVLLTIYAMIDYMIFSMYPRNDIGAPLWSAYIAAIGIAPFLYGLYLVKKEKVR